MTKNPRQELKNWLEQNPNKKENLPAWDKIINVWPETQENICGRHIILLPISKIVDLAFNWKTEDGKLSDYFYILMLSPGNFFSSWCQVEGNRWDMFIENIVAIVEGSKELATKLQKSENTLNTTQQQLDQFKSELTKEEQEHQQLADKLTTEQNKSNDLEQQLTTLAVSTGLLTQQVENLTNQLTESQQTEERSRLESEIKANLIREQGDKLSQQEQQNTSYQQLLRTSEENLKKCQEIITKKNEQLEGLDREKNLIGEELELANGKIKELEQALLTANSKISQLEARIKELQKSDNNSAEIERLKKELTNQKTKSQQEINRLKQELNQTKLREEALADKIKELGKKPVKVQETVETSFWDTIKTPLYYGLGIILVIMFLGWIWSILKDE